MPTKLDEAHKKKRTEVLFFAERPRVLLRKRHRRLRTLLVLISAHKKKENRSSLFCGATEIRTRDTLLGYTRFPGVPLQPLEHRSLCLDNGCHQLLVVQIYEIFFDLPLFDCIYFHHFRLYSTEYTIY